MNPELHKVQLHILDTLRRAQSQTFSQLMKPSGLESDAFKFHIRKLCALELVAKTPQGHYQLTLKGKEFANKLNRATRSARQQPKLSVLVFSQRPTKTGEVEYLCQKRLRQPFYEFWSGGIGGPILWGEEWNDTAQRELHKQTGLTAKTFETVLFYRKRDYNKTDTTLLEDKLFVVLEAKGLSGHLTNTWPGGYNQWLTLSALTQKEKHFSTLRDIIQAQKTQQRSLSQIVRHHPDTY